LSAGVSWAVAGNIRLATNGNVNRMRDFIRKFLRESFGIKCQVCWAR
jgi:hypothetical protein